MGFPTAFLVVRRKAIWSVRLRSGLRLRLHSCPFDCAQGRVVRPRPGCFGTAEAVPLRGLWWAWGWRERSGFARCPRPKSEHGVSSFLGERSDVRTRPCLNFTKDSSRTIPQMVVRSRMVPFTGFKRRDPHRRASSVLFVACSTSFYVGIGPLYRSAGAFLEARDLSPRCRFRRLAVIHLCLCHRSDADRRRACERCPHRY